MNSLDNYLLSPVTHDPFMEDGPKNLNTQKDNFLSEIILRCKSHGDHTALIFQGRAFTYRELDLLSNNIARYLASQKINHSSIVALSMNRSFELICTLLAVLKCGASYVFIDKALPRDRVSYILQDSNAGLLIADTDEPAYAELTQISFSRLLEEIASFPGEFETREIEASTLAYTIYTSGSTGKPKGVMIAHGNISNLLNSFAIEPGVDSRDRILATTSLSFDISVIEIFLPLFVGGCIILAGEDERKDPAWIVETIRTQNPTTVQGTPSFFQLLMYHGWSDKTPIRLFCGGERLDSRLAEQMMELSDEVWNMYGPTETTVYSIIKKVDLGPATIPIGHPILNTRIFILNENFEEVEAGTEGEIYISGAGVGLGYMSRNSMNEGRFIENSSFAPNGKMFRTGDIGKAVTPNEFVWLRRRDEQIKFNGYRIEPGEIETVIREVQNVSGACVVVRDITPMQQILAAYVSTTNLTDDPGFVEKIQRKLSESFPAYMIPRVTILKDLPLTLSGKIDKSALKALPDSVLNEGTTKKVTVQTRLFALWKKYLQLDKFETNQSFFELGGHSLIAIQLIAGIEKEFAIKLPMSAFFHYQTIDELADYISNNSRPALQSSIVPVKPTGTNPPLYIVHGGGSEVMFTQGLSMLMDSNQPVYGLEALGVRDEDPTHHSIEATVEIFTKDLMAHNPTDYFMVAGYSFGGSVAFEIAKKLKQHGKSVLLVGLFDAFAPFPTERQLRQESVWRWLKYETGKIVFRGKKLISRPKYYLQQIAKYKDGTIPMLVRRFLSEDRSDLVANSVEIDPKLVFLQEAHQKAIDDHKFEPAELIVDLFKCNDELFYCHDMQYYGWRPYAKAGVNVYHIPANHYNLFSSPQVSFLAKQLQQAIDRSIISTTKKEGHDNTFKIVSTNSNASKISKYS